MKRFFNIFRKCQVVHGQDTFNHKAPLYMEIAHDIRDNPHKWEKQNYYSAYADYYVRKSCPEYKYKDAIHIRVTDYYLTISTPGNISFSNEEQAYIRKQLKFWEERSKAIEQQKAEKEIRRLLGKL